jgi:restriction system protein
MAIWIVRAGSRGEREDFALENNVAVAGWPRCPFDLAEAGTRQEMGDILLKAYPHESIHTRANWVGQLWRFVQEIEVGDLILIPLKQRRYVAVGEISSDYYYVKENNPGFRHLRRVRCWKEIHRDDFDPDLWASFIVRVTVARAKCIDGEQRIRKMLIRTLDIGKKTG